MSTSTGRGREGRSRADQSTLTAQEIEDRRAATLEVNAKLLSLNADIRKFEHWVVVAKRRRRLMLLSCLLGPVLLLALYALFWLPFLNRSTLVALGIPGFIVAGGLLVSALKFSLDPGGGPRGVVDSDKDRYGEPIERRRSEGELELLVAQTRDSRKLLVADGVFDEKTRRLIYKDDAYGEIERLRKESKRYRNVNNVLQGILIVGSITATAAAGIGAGGGPIRWVVLGVSLAIGAASGFMGYYKYKERSFYLQQTADAIEHEWEAFEVGVGRYKYCEDEETALQEFVEEVHRLKSEQRKRQQNLEQPPEIRNAGEL